MWKNREQSADRHPDRVLRTSYLAKTTKESFLLFLLSHAHTSGKKFSKGIFNDYVVQNFYGQESPLFYLVLPTLLALVIYGANDKS